jgi:cyclopropane fatty-acyl-phospholipid synthase-like methyltransferase
MKKHIHAPRKLTRKQKDELLSGQLPGLLQYHQTMLNDGVRNKMLYEAIKRHVTEETNFLDIGAGTGVWAILAAKLGAKRVVAVEIEEPLIPIMFKHAQENGVAQKIEIIHGNSDFVKLRGKFDVIVSELFGGDALGEATAKSFVSLRDRFLAPHGVLIPQKLTMLAAPVRINKSVQNIPSELPLVCSFLKSIKLNYGQNLSIDEREKVKFLAEPQKLVEVDFRTVQTHPNLQNLSAAWQMDNLSEANAIAVFNNSTFTDELVMNSFLSQSWGATVYEFQPFPEGSGGLRFTMTMDGPKSMWAVQEMSSNKAQNYSPTFAPARIKMAQQMSFYRKVRPPKPMADKNKMEKIKE